MYNFTIPDQVLWTRKQIGVRGILRVCKDRARLRSEYVFAKLCQE